MFAAIKTEPLLRPAMIALAAIGALCVAAPASAQVRFAPQIAVYDLSLENSSDGSIVAATGRLAIQLTDTCDGYALTERMVLELTPSEGEPTVLDSQFSSYETRDGALYRYSSQLTVNGAPLDETEGVGRIENGAGRAEVVKPRPGELDLPEGVMFPLRFSAGIIEAALNGERSFEAPYFDGDGDNPTVLGSAQLIAETTGRDDREGNGRSWFMTLAFFERDAGADSPLYQSTLRLYENGVADNMLLNYGSFVIRTTLSELEILPSGCD